MTDNVKYYKRGLYMINKLLNTFKNDSSFYKKREELVEKEYLRYSNFTSLVAVDIRAFTLTSLVALLGLNKENIENIDKNAEYNFIIFDKNKLKEIEKIKELDPEFEKDRIINTKYDSWLNVLNCNLIGSNYMFNLRNSLLHSEYNFHDKYGNIIYLKNSNYTKFEGKLLLPVFKDFALFYFGNTTWTGLSENTKLYNIESDKKIPNEKELDRIIDTVGIIEIEYQLKEEKNKVSSPENKLYKLVEKKQIKENTVYKQLEKLYRNNSNNHSIKTVKLTEEQKKIVKKMIKTYYNEDYYKLNENEQKSAIIYCTKYLLDSRTVISEWIVDYIKTLSLIETLEVERRKTKLTPKDYYNKIKNNVEDAMNTEKNLRSVFACKTALMIIKVYQILYRIQNDELEEIDYNKINYNYTSKDYKYTKIDINGITTVNNFTDDITKVQSKEPSLTYLEAQNKVVCEIIRDALSHGKVDITFKINKNDELEEYIVFNDQYHSKIRKIEMTLNKFEELLNSEAFTIVNTKTKTIALTKTK